MSRVGGLACDLAAVTVIRWAMREDTLGAAGSVSRRAHVPQRRNLAHVALAGDGLGIAERDEAAHDATPASAFSAATWRRTSAKVAGSCAPETPYFRSMTKNGTPWMPNSRATA